MNDEARKLFEELGSTVAKELAFRDSWVFVGAKGIENKSPFEQVHSAVHHFLISGNLLCAKLPTDTFMMCDYSKVIDHLCENDSLLNMLFFSIPNIWKA